MHSTHKSHPAYHRISQDKYRPEKGCVRLEKIVSLLVLGVVFVNGWTDAPNAILSAVCSKALTYRKAVLLAAVCNILGLLFVCFTGFQVGETMLSMVDFSSQSRLLADGALCAGMIAVILFAVGAWRFGIPTSESHALIAALTGAALALNYSRGIQIDQWVKVLYGLGVSLVAGAIAGYLADKLFHDLLVSIGRKNRTRFQILTAMSLALAHGAQDGQKILAVLILLWSPGKNDSTMFRFILLVGGVMALGTLAGGKRIIQNLGENMVQIGDESGIASDIAAILCIVGASAWGIPVSTTHTKTMAVIGSAAAEHQPSQHGKIKELFYAWALTFPVCGAIGYILTVIWKLIVSL